MSRGVSGRNSFEFTPLSLGLPVGVYHAILTTAQSETTQREIRNAALLDPSIVYSADITIVVESPVAPTILGPRGTVFSPTPTFEWEGIPGVPAYVIAVSSTPFELRTDPQTNDPVVEGLTPVWGALTTETSATYGQASPDSPFPNLPAPPLVPGREYYFTVVNTYSKTDASLISEAFGGVVAFRYEAFTGLLAPVLTSPEDGSRFNQTPTLTFGWEPVQGAASYTFTLTERQTIGGSVGDVPVFTISTPSTSLELDALRLMRRGTYTWSVIPNEATGAAGLSAERSFRYDTPMGAYRFRPRSAHDGTAILGVRVDVDNLDGRHAPLVPLVNTTESYSDSLVASRYLFRASRSQYADTTVAVTVRAGALTEFEIALRPLPARLSGTVTDGEGGPIENARVSLARQGTEVSSTITDSQGRYAFSLPPGTYAITSRLAGYGDGVLEGIVVAPNDQLELPPLPMEAVAGFVSGRVINEAGRPVQLASVLARSGTRLQSIQTSGEGAFDFVLAAGTWTLSATKEGFLGARPVQITVSRGERISDVLVVLTEQASQVSGTLFGLVEEASGALTRRALAGAEILAVPSSGGVLSTRSDESGSFVLALGAGSYAISARAAGYADSDRIWLRLGLAESVSGLELEMRQYAGGVSGRIVNLSGSPVAGATLVLDALEPGFRTIQADAAGRYSLSVPPGTHTLLASAPGHEDRSVTFGVGPAESLSGLTITLSPAAATVSGTVTQAGAPVPHALVRAESGSQSTTVRADEGGRYTVRIPAGTWAVSARGFTQHAAAPVTIAIQAGQAVTGLDFDLATREAILQGAVTEAGAPLAGTRITVAGSQTIQTVSRTVGLFAVTVPADEGLTVRFEKEGYHAQTVVVSALSHGEVRTISIELQKAASSLAGRVVTIDGIGVPGARVQATQAGETRNTVTRHDGSYLLAVPAGAHEVSAIATGYSRSARSLTLAVGERRSGVDFQLSRAGGQLLLRVTDTGGLPLAGARATLTGPGGIRTGVSSSEGTVRFSQLDAGVYQVALVLAGYVDHLLDNVVLSDAQTAEIIVALAQATASLTGTVTDQAGTPVAGALVRVKQGSPNAGASTQTGLDGRFALQGLLPGLLSLEILAPGFESGGTVGIDVTGDTIAPVVVLIRRAESLLGRVSVVGSGESISGAQLTLFGMGGAATTQSNDVGEFAFGQLSRGDYALVVTAPGFRRHESSITVPTAAPVAIGLITADGRVSGRVLDAQGSALGFPVRVIAAAGGATITVTTDTDGHFSVTGLDPLKSWVLRTDISRPGYRNGETVVTFPSGEVAITGVAIAVHVETAGVVGSVGTPGASVRLLRAGSGEVVAITTSLSAGSFAFRYLPSGSYRVVPEKSGVSFTPAFRDLTVAQAATAQADFQAISSVGSIALRAVNVLMQPIPAVDVVVASVDGLVVRSALTDGSGRAVFQGLPLGREYTIRPSLTGFSSTPRSITTALRTPEQVEFTFQFTEATGRIRGNVQNDSQEPIAQGSVTAVHLETGIVYTGAISGGTYQVQRLPGGAYFLTAAAPGYREESGTYTLAEGQDLDGVNFRLRLASVILQGQVTYRGRGLQGVRVTARARNELVTVSDALGTFRFAALPLDRPAPDTTHYTLTISPHAGSPVQRFISIPGERLGQVISVPTIPLPSASIHVDVDDGLAPVGGADLIVEYPGGTVERGVTDAEGAFRSAETLGAGVYRVSVLKPGRLTPEGNHLRIQVPSDTSAARLRVPMPFRHEAPAVVSSASPTTLRVLVTGGYPTASVSGEATYTVAGIDRTVPLSIVQGALEAAIPASQSTELIPYSVRVEDSATGFNYSTGRQVLQPTAPGTLATLRVEPALGGRRLRVGEAYDLSLVVRDGVGNSLLELFGPGSGGSVSWQLAGPGAELHVPNPSEPWRARLEVGDAGTLRLEVQAQLGGVRLTQTSESVAGVFQPDSMTLTSPVPAVSNESPGVQLAYRALTEDGGEQVLGSSLVWTVSPSNAGTVSPSGLFIPTDPGFLGPVTITVGDRVTGKKASTSLSVFRRLTPGTAARLNDGFGAFLEVPAGAVPFAADLSLTRPSLAGPKRSATPHGQRNRFTAGDGLVRFSMRADRALPGDSLLAPVRLTLPEDPSLRLLQGSRSLARFDASTLRWHLLESVDSGAEVTASSAYLAEFGTLVPNQALGLAHVAVLPNPFSPNIAPLKIGYLLTSAEPPASVTIRVFNVRGELVRTLLESDTQQPGRYGSATSEKMILWDGLTDAGTQARNGRYVIEIKATDTTGTANQRISVVLVK